MHWRVVAARNIADGRYSKVGLTLAEVAAELGVSSHYLGKLFHRETGQSFHAYLFSVRMEAAKEMLCDPLVTAQQVGYRVGYNDASNFCRAFRSRFGVTPHSYFERLQLARLRQKKTP